MKLALVKRGVTLAMALFALAFVYSWLRSFHEFEEDFDKIHGGMDVEQVRSIFAGKLQLTRHAVKNDGTRELCFSQPAIPFVLGGHITFGFDRTGLLAYRSISPRKIDEFWHHWRRELRIPKLQKILKLDLR